MRKPVFRVFDQVSHKPGCTALEDGWRLEISDCTIHVVKTKAVICCAVTAQPLFSHMQKSGFFMMPLIIYIPSIIKS